MAGRLTQLAREVRKRAPRKRVYIWLKDWQRAVFGIDTAPEGFSLAGPGKCLTLRRGDRIVAMLAYSPPQPPATDDELRAACEARMTEQIRREPEARPMEPAKENRPHE